MGCVSTREPTEDEPPQWLRVALGLSDRLIADLTAWGTAMIETATAADSR